MDIAAKPHHAIDPPAITVESSQDLHWRHLIPADCRGPSQLDVLIVWRLGVRWKIQSTVFGD